MIQHTCTIANTASWENTVLDFLHIRCTPGCPCGGEGHTVEITHIKDTPVNEHIALCAAAAKALDGNRPNTAYVVTGVESGHNKRKEPGDTGPRTVLAIVYITQRL